MYAYQGDVPPAEIDSRQLLPTFKLVCSQQVSRKASKSHTRGIDRNECQHLSIVIAMLKRKGDECIQAVKNFIEGPLQVLDECQHVKS